MIKAINNNNVEFISKYDSEIDKTIFLIGSISAQKMSIINDMMSKWRVENGEMKEIVISNSQRNFEIVKNGLKGWKNFKDKDKELEFNEKNINKIPFEIINELAEKILEINTLSFDDKKK